MSETRRALYRSCIHEHRMGHGRYATAVTNLANGPVSWVMDAQCPSQRRCTLTRASVWRFKSRALGARHTHALPMDSLLLKARRVSFSCLNTWPP